MLKNVALDFEILTVKVPMYSGAKDKRHGRSWASVRTSWQCFNPGANIRGWDTKKLPNFFLTQGDMLRPDGGENRGYIYLSLANGVTCIPRNKALEACLLVQLYRWFALSHSSMMMIILCHRLLKSVFTILCRDLESDVESTLDPRLSILFTIIRLSIGRMRRILTIVSFLFFLPWIVLSAQVWCVCESKPGWKDAKLPQLPITCISRRCLDFHPPPFPRRNEVVP
ncbi:uncharacterized protein BT62DRAFT_1079135 [Guyanagaster necrorhizus]|uniref:Uncharacterized protein n=1 Tax=Guyanagaster necrorhizus TaxID=856835 RepID=A0A9P7VMT7_9AGAR|nr:uncharacterized protein BT62DRAFT_1079135 [Guyanagaster necrorhizus MCA 3950]KAG7442769.1 hypothetical protein BT62DRAFT_1079135 [Guyanagaster necrorhizus MCA 3950]